MSNCRQIITAIRIYAADNGGSYPDVMLTEASSNQAFRVLFTEGVLDQESVFGCPVSPFKPDGKIGREPHFKDALKRGENHWAMTKGLVDASPGHIPLVFENPVGPQWPPRWNADAVGKPVKGRSWKGGKIIIGRNDSSVSAESLVATTGTSVPLAPDATGQNLFEQAIDPKGFPKGEILDVE